MREWNLRRAQRELLHMLGFGIFANTHVVLGTDARLVSALIERWRPETNTFFLRQGEMTITLEDVDQEVENALYRGHIKLTSLFDRYGRQKPEKHNDEATVIHTHAYLLFVIGAVLFPSKDKATVHVRNIQPLLNIREIPNYAWGAAVLAHLYRGLEIAARRNSKTVAACVWLLEVWSYERFPRIGVPQRDPNQEDYPVAEGWAYSSLQGVNKKRRQSGPHHSLPFYRGEFNGVARDDVVWRPYARFDESLDWEMLQAQIARNARVSLVCFDVVEWQHSERVIRQFGSSPQIPPVPVNMLPYRQPKATTFAGEDWMIRWFVDIGRWARFCSELEGAVDENVNVVYEAVYMTWYSDISRTRVGKPEPVPQSQYSTRELYDTLEGYRVMIAGLDMLKKLDSRVPAEFVEELGKVSDTFLRPFTRLMKKIKGPAYKHPKFENIKAISLDDITQDSQPPEPTVAAISDHDVIEMTQPS
ncbi:hypothetical protein POM88_022129 [Heracleum sosnowskyi]|uniref:Aminotransferase-like plant mobile domain-containing protein n=1 Tax=Heracleum sosnowskyi TaxID=360622 RepID=A0AAD8MTF2_9APIA|nr:hypothetical protein POM88_022129 [Heracleum sosnowskyi]